MSKIIVIPLDERPCNAIYPIQLSHMSPNTVVVPPIALLGHKKQPANIEAIHNWLLKEAKEATAIVVAFDMLLYGGIIPSRLHNNDVATLSHRLNILFKIKENNPQIKIYGYSLIMRNPSYSSNDEEPDYYEEWGEAIHMRGVYEHKKLLGTLTSHEVSKLESIQKTMPLAYYEDYTHRRHTNKIMNKKIVQLKKQGIVDELVIPQDDSSPYGLTKQDQLEMIQYIKDAHLENDILIYPGADEVSLTLLARLITHKEKTFLIYPYYRHVEGKNIIPLYEDRPLSMSVEAQIKSAGCQLALTLEEADAVLFLNNTNGSMLDLLPHLQEDSRYDHVSLQEFLNHVEDYDGTKGIADVYYTNGSDTCLIQGLQERALLFTVHGYAGWNTSSNTLGTAISMLVMHHFYGHNPQHLRHKNMNLAHRYVEDYLYQAKTRDEIIHHKLDQYHCTYFRVDGPQGQVAGDVGHRLEEEIELLFADTPYNIYLRQCLLPWERMFEVQVDLTLDTPLKTIGIDLGGTQIKGAVVCEDGYVMQEECIPTHAQEGRQGILSQLCTVVESLMEAHTVSAIGIGTAGRVNTETGQIIYATDNLPGWQGVGLKACMEKAYNIPTFVDNDGNTALLGEMWLGAGKHYKDAVMITLGTGVGGAIFQKGDILRGAHYHGGELGHMTLYRHGKECNCGRQGCVEQYLSGTALIKSAQEAISPHIKHGKEFMMYYKENDQRAVKIMHRLIEDMQAFIADLEVIIDPECIIIGGGVMESAHLWWHLLEDKQPYIQAQLLPARLGNHAGYMGAAWMALQQIKSRCKS
ncbi:DUF4127 family protein [Vallitalea pronyensis]|uniref:DUF4127 family protein n=1 Tax=Vallitalea pronyensis TaxID=1348613 RepID=A0A8J8SH39_9FIRM|nr:DUF4127 family protein [Vallitalea pronyensis]QUI22963.1 DUF4127 family protein [Vallitalea pronyensis]